VGDRQRQRLASIPAQRVDCPPKADITGFGESFMTRYLAKVAASGIAGGLAWQLGMLVFFGPAQAILADPELQSGKFNAVFQSITPLPRTAGQPMLLLAGLIGISLIYAAAHDAIRAALSGTLTRRAIKFGLILWAVMVPWFEFYLPWDVMGEPFPLVLLECLCWFGVMQLVALAIVVTDRRISTLFE
jgi:hypothetical protein